MTGLAHPRRFVNEAIPEGFGYADDFLTPNNCLGWAPSSVRPGDLHPHTRQRTANARSPITTSSW